MVNGEFSFTHEYPSLQPYNAKIILDDYSNLYNLNLSSQEINSVQGTNLLIGIIILDLTNNNLTTIPTIVNNANIESLSFNGNYITETSLNDTLVYLDSTFINAFSFTSRDQTPSAIPSGVGEIAANNLRANGCNIITD